MRTIRVSIKARKAKTSVIVAFQKRGQCYYVTADNSREYLRIRKAGRVVTMEDGDRYYTTKGEDWVAERLVINKSGKSVNEGAVGFGSSPKGAYLNTYDFLGI